MAINSKRVWKYFELVTVCFFWDNHHSPVIVFRLQSQWCKVWEVLHKASIRFHTRNSVNQDVTMKYLQYCGEKKSTLKMATNWPVPSSTDVEKLTFSLKTKFICEFIQVYGCWEVDIFARDKVNLRVYTCVQLLRSWYFRSRQSSFASLYMCTVVEKLTFSLETKFICEFMQS
jgi:succinate dehydrogenase hydrophobic anchor subunit